MDFFLLCYIYIYILSLYLISINDILWITIEIDRHFHFNKRLWCHGWRITIVTAGISPTMKRKNSIEMKTANKTALLLLLLWRWKLTWREHVLKCVILDLSTGRIFYYSRRTDTRRDDHQYVFLHAFYK